MTLTIPLLWPAPPIALNDSHGNKWTESAGRRKVRSEARWAIRAARPQPVEGPWPVRFALHWRIPDRRIRDADRLAKVAKGCLDALVDEAVLPADDWRYVAESACIIHPPIPSKAAAMWIEITATEEPA